MAGGHFRNKYMSTGMKVGMCLIGKNEQSGLTEGMVGDEKQIIGSFDCETKVFIL